MTALILAVGVAMILAAWLGASGSTDWDTQVSWTALALLGVITVGVGVGIWLFRGFARVHAQAREVRRLLETRVSPGSRTDEDTSGTRERVTAAGMRLSHRPDCLLVRGKETAAAGPGLDRCRVCG